MDAEALLYERVADRVADWITRGVLRAGDRVPSVRKLSRQEGVSVATVVQAFQQLEVRGLIEARPQSGHYVRTPRARANIPEPRAPRTTHAAARPSVAHLVAKVYGAARDPRLVNLGSAIPSPELLPAERILKITATVARQVGRLAVSYDPPPGCAALRRQIARRAVDVGSAIPADEIVTTVGAMEALHLALRAVARAGDTVAVESPAYYGLLQLIESLGIRAIEIPAHPGSGMDLDALEVALDTTKIAAVMAIPSFSNPLGSRMSNDGKRRLVSLLAARAIPLIEDDVYGDLPFPGAAPPGEDERPRPAKAFDRDGSVILCSSFSKTIAPGYRVGWIAGGRHHETIEALKFAQTIATPSLQQLAIAEFIEGGGYDHHLRQLRRKLAAQVAQMREAIGEHFPEGTRVSSPTGGFVLWIELPAGSAIDLHARALAEGISIAPGPIFSARSRFASYFRVSCGAPWSGRVEAAVEKLGAIARSLGRHGRG
ncbi:MAG: PLP-dependent aminotransferase family protein [Deltaproteobacteria bacterium]|nr:PLP-dependent aminotransferase family protein [Deltaproteobacteria bacterium]